MDSAQMEELCTRIDKLEKVEKEGYLTLLEMLSSVTFFGGLKKTNCEYAKDGQCSLFYLKMEAKNKIPVATECRIPECSNNDHCHLDLSNITCTFCPQWNNGQSFVKSEKKNSSRRKTKRQEKQP